jgi:PAS domain S-box-containing protein
MAGARLRPILGAMATDVRSFVDLRSLFPGDGEMASRCRALDWAATPLGPPSLWSPALRTIVRTTMESTFPTNLWCGSSLVLIYNDGYREVLGAKHPRALGRPGSEVWAEIWPQIAPLFDRIRAGGAAAYASDAPFLMERTAGPPGEAWFTFSLSPVRDDDERIVAFLNVAAETTPRMLAERELEAALAESEGARDDAEASEARYRFLANSIPVQVWTATPDGKLDYVSDRTAQIIGRSVSEIVGDGWIAALHADDVARTVARWRESLESGAPYEIEVRLWSVAHGGYRWHLARATPQHGSDGTIIRWFGTNTDIEDRKQAQAELERLTRDALEADRVKSAFLAAMSHDLRTPLNAIGGYAQLIEMGVRGPVTEEQRTDLRRIQRSKNHLDRLVGDVLTFAKLGSGRVEVRSAPVDVASGLLPPVLEMIAPQLAEKGLALAPVLAPDGLEVSVDGDKVRQVLVNLLANAVKFTPPGGTVGVAVTTADDLFAIEVRDTGVGIPAAELERIFEPFVQSSHALRAADRGVGLGLAISRELARAMDGELTATSEVGVGSTFRLTLPRAPRGT